MAENANSTGAPKRRRLFAKNVAAVIAGAPEIGPTKIYTLTEEEERLSPDVARFPYMLRYLEACGAEYSECQGRSSWFQAIWSDPDLSDEPICWACSADRDDMDSRYACVFFALSKMPGIKARCGAPEKH